MKPLVILVLTACILLGTITWGQNSINQLANKSQSRQLKSAPSSEENESKQLFNRLPLSYTPDVKKDIRDAVFLEINYNELTRINKTKSSLLNLTIPVSANNEVTFALHDVQILTDNFSIITGNNEKVNYTPGLYYQGTVPGVSPSLVAFSMFESSIMAVFSYNNANYVLGVWNDKSNVNKNIYILYKDSDVLYARDFKCGVDEMPKTLSGNGDPGQLLSNQCIKVYFECDYQMFLDKGSVINVGNYVTGMFNVVEALYNVEIINTEISEIYVWSTTDPYVSYTTSTDLLNNFQTTRTTFNGTVAHLLTTRNIGVGGLAYLDILCTPANAYGMSNIDNTYDPYPNYCWTSEVVTHELGHNFGSHHTHWCGWPGGPIDNCVAVDDGPCSPGPTPTNGGTIMSYCHLSSVGILLTNGFGSLPGNYIRTQYNAASCLTACANLPTADFSASPVISCSAPQIVNFTDLSLGLPLSWAWDIDNNGTTDYTTQNPTHTYSTAGTYSVKLTTTNANGNNTITKTNYVIVGGATLPFIEDFENTTFPPLGWSVTQSPPPNDIITWYRNTSAAGNGASTGCAFITNYYTNFNYASTGGEKDNLISKPVSLVGVSSPSMTFKVAYKNYQNPANYDTLRVYVSTNCGVSYGAPVYVKGGTVLATSGSTATEFTPTIAGDWRTETVSLTSFVGSNIIVKFESTNHVGNDIYIDDINITGVVSSAPNANFLASDTIVCVGQCISLTDQSTNSPTSWAWTFTGAATTSSTLQNPTNICYNTPGTYGITLVATNGIGPNTETKTNYITVGNVAPVVTTSITSGSNPTCTGQSLTFTAVPTNGGTTPAYQWKVDGSAVGTNSATFTSSTLTNGQVVTCVMTSNLSCASPTTATSTAITITSAGSVVPAVVTSITTGTNPTCTGQSLSFTAVPTNGGTTPSYQWKVDGSPVGTNSTTFTTSTLTNGQVVTCVMTSTLSCASPATDTSTAITITSTSGIVPVVSTSITSGSNPTCAGQSLTFTAVPTNGGTTPAYQWNVDGTPVGTNSTTYTTSTLTTGQIVTCVMTSNLGCASPTTATSTAITITLTGSVAPSVSIAVTSGSNPTCAGASITFTATPSGGGSTPVYQWKVDGSNIGTNSATFITSSLTNGQSVTCVMTSNLSCASPTTATSTAIIITTNSANTPSVLVALTSGSNPTCGGLPLTFTATPTNGGTTPVYQWKINGGNVGTGGATYTSSTLTDGQVITCLVTSNEACANPTTVSSAGITIAVTPAPTINYIADKNVCGGDIGASSFSSTPSGASYTWTNSNTAIGLAASGTGNVPAFTAVNSTSSAITATITVTPTINGACVGTPSSYTITVNPTPAITQSGSVLTCSSSSSYQWYWFGQPVIGATSQTYTPTQNGDYNVLVAGNACPSGVVTVTNTGIGQINNNNFFTIYPNPNDGNFTISFDVTKKANYTLEFINALGALVYEETLIDFNGTYAKQMDLTKYGKGMYLISLSNAGMETIKKVIVY